MTQPKDWEYCECGCHCHILILNGVRYSIFNDLGKGGSDKHFHLSKEVRVGNPNDKLGRYSSFAKADEAAYTDAGASKETMEIN